MIVSRWYEMTGDEKKTRSGNIRKSVIGSNIHIDSKYNFTQFGSNLKVLDALVVWCFGSQ